jgi:tetratricopeptide (TPR) repeat protein
VGLSDEAGLLAHLALTRIQAGDTADGIALADEALTVACRQGARVVECLAHVTRAQACRASGKADAAAADLDAAIRLVQKTGALTYEPFIREEIGRLHRDEGQLREALRLYRQIGATGHARRLEAELAARSLP